MKNLEGIQILGGNEAHLLKIKPQFAQTSQFNSILIGFDDLRDWVGFLNSKTDTFKVDGIFSFEKLKPIQSYLVSFMR